MPRTISCPYSGCSSMICSCPLRRQRPVLAQEPRGHAQLPHVVQDPGEPQHFYAPSSMPSSRAIIMDACPTRSTVPRVYPSLMSTACTRARMVAWWAARSPAVLGERPAGHVHRQQHEQRGDGTVLTAPQHRHHQPGEPVHGDAGEGAREEPAPGTPHRHPLGERQDPAVERGQDQTEGEHRGPGGHERVREVAGRSRPGRPAPSAPGTPPRPRRRAGPRARPGAATAAAAPHGRAARPAAPRARRPTAAAERPRRAARQEGAQPSGRLARLRGRRHPWGCAGKGIRSQPAYSAASRATIDQGARTAGSGAQEATAARTTQTR